MEAEKKGLANPKACKRSSAAAAAAAPTSSTTSSSNAVTSGKGDVKALPAAEDAAVNGTLDRVKGSKGAADSKAEADEQQGQEIDLVFIAPKTGNYSLALVAMSDCWVGCDETVQVGESSGQVGESSGQGGLQCTTGLGFAALLACFVLPFALLA
jgi:hypothetical protein